MPTRTEIRHTEPGSRLPTVAIVGRPNVGKSTLFNRVLGSRRAIVAEEPGVTRDRQFAPVEWSGRPFLLVDTGGLVADPDRDLEEEIRRQVVAAIDRADAIVFVVDGRTGLHPVDEHVAELLRRSGRSVVLAVNKVDDLADAREHYDFYRLGLGDPQPLSALSGKGSGDLLDRVVEALPEPGQGGEEPAAELRLAVVGKPNVGKSSLVNRLLGENRVIVHGEAGTTRDAIDTYLEFEGTRICLIDTAGLRRGSRVTDDVEFYSRVRAAAAMDRADVCLLLVDSEQGVTNQDFQIGERAWAEGCGLVFVANKWDLVDDPDPGTVDRFAAALRERAPYLRRVPIVTASALTGRRVEEVVRVAREVQGNRRRRIATAEVNERLRELLERRQPPQGSRGEVRILYASQVGTEPPLFALWVNHPDQLARHYVRYLENGFRDTWNFEGVPVRMKLRKRQRRG